MSNERVDELTKETLEDTTSKSPEETTEPVEEPAKEEPVVDPSNPEPTGEGEEADLQVQLDDANAKLTKSNQVNENYKRELKGFRKKSLTDEPVDKPDDKTKESVVDITKNFQSKKQDTLEEFSNKFEGLNEEQFGKVKRLIKATTQGVLDKALKENRYVAQGELNKAVEELVNYAKGPTVKTPQAEIDKEDVAEISAVKANPRETNNPSAQDKVNAEENDRTPEKEKEIRELREQRLKDYKVT